MSEQVTETSKKEGLITSYGVILTDKGSALYVKNLSDVHITGFVSIGNPTFSQIRHLGFSRLRPITQKEYIEMGAFKNGGRAKNNIIDELGFLSYLWQKPRFLLTKLLYWREFRRQNQRYEERQAEEGAQ
jgi:hypothetical protein